MLFCRRGAGRRIGRVVAVKIVGIVFIVDKAAQVIYRTNTFAKYIYFILILVLFVQAALLAEMLYKAACLQRLFADRRSILEGWQD